MQAGRANPPLFISRMGQMEAHANLDELHLLGQAEVQRLEEEVVEAYEVQEEEDSKKLSGMSESPELPRKIMDGRRCTDTIMKHLRVSRCCWLFSRTHLKFF